MKDFRYHSPKSLQMAIELASLEDSVIMNGGTDVIIQMRDRMISPDNVIDIKHIPGLKDITFSKEKGLHIGSCATMNEVADSENVKAFYPFLAKAARSVGSKQVRNRATVAGNLINASPLADTATPLLCLNAVLLVEGNDGYREIPLHEFFVFVRKTTLKPDEIVTGIRIPYYEGIRGVFTKISRRKEVDLSTICSTVTLHNGLFCVAFGAVAPTPLRLYETEKHLNMNALSPEVIEKAVLIAQGEVKPIDDVRASKQYRLDVVGVALRQSLDILMRGGMRNEV